MQAAAHLLLLPIGSKSPTDGFCMEYIPLAFMGFLAAVYVGCSIVECVLTFLDWLSRRRRPGILIMTQNRGYLRILEKWFRNEGFNVWSTEHEQGAVDLVQFNAKEIDLALLDAGTDNPAGTASSLRRELPFLPCCFMKQKLNDADESYLFYLGAIAVFDKPLLLRESTRVIRQIIKQSRRHG
ncbi:MAG: hypothetical protein AB7K24_16455 [Gemmataceae bacterium]